MFGLGLGIYLVAVVIAILIMAQTQARFFRRYNDYAAEEHKVFTGLTPRDLEEPSRLWRETPDQMNRGLAALAREHPDPTVEGIRRRAIVCTALAFLVMFGGLPFLGEAFLAQPTSLPTPGVLPR